MKLTTSMMLCNKVSQKFVDLVDNKHVQTIVLPFGAHSITHSISLIQRGPLFGRGLSRDRVMLVLPVSLLHKKSRHVYLRTEKVRMLIRYNMKKNEVSEREKGVLWYVHVCYQLNEQTFETPCCTTSSKSSISSLRFRY